ncbi:hypothetical protein Tco_0309263 [Tanacetum coccineum]
MFTILTSIATEIRNRLHKLTAAEMLTVNHRIEEGRFKRQDAGRFTTESTTLEEATVEGNIALAKQVWTSRLDAAKPHAQTWGFLNFFSNGLGRVRAFNVLVRAYPGLCRPRDGVENPLVIAIKAYTTISERDLNIDTRLSTMHNNCLLGLTPSEYFTQQHETMRTDAKKFFQSFGKPVLLLSLFLSHWHLLPW